MPSTKKDRKKLYSMRLDPKKVEIIKQIGAGEMRNFTQEIEYMIEKRLKEYSFLLRSGGEADNQEEY